VLDPPEGWPPDLAVAWLVEAMLTGGSATIDDVPSGGVRTMR
jgi:hypothetical protein